MTMREYVNGFPVVIVRNTCNLQFKWVCINQAYYVNQQYAQEFYTERERLIQKYETADSTETREKPVIPMKQRISTVAC